MRRYRYYLLMPLGIGVVVLAYAMCGGFGWTDLNSRYDQIDISTGRVRHFRYLFYQRIDEKVEDSIITDWLQEPADVEPKWRTVNMLTGFLTHSPQYTFHGALSQIHRLSQIDSLLPLTPDAKNHVASNVIYLWNSHNRDSKAGEYVRAVFSRALMLCDEASQLEVMDLKGLLPVDDQ